MELFSGVLSIVLIDLVLSGDNAVVIGLAAHRLPPRQRRIAIVFGGGAAIVLRISLTAVATLLLAVPGLRAVGGVLLVWIAFKLLQEEEESVEGVKVAASMMGAIVTILIADFIMSLDNVLGVAAAARGSVGLLIFGLTLSMAILMIGGTVVATLVNRLWWLAYVGGAVIAWTGADMLLEEPLIEHTGFAVSGVLRPLIPVAITAATLALAHYVHRYRPAVQRERVKLGQRSGAIDNDEAVTQDPRGDRGPRV